MANMFQLTRNFFSKPVPVETLGWFRISTGLFALVQFFVLLPDWMAFYGPHGVIPWEISDALSTKSTLSMSDLANLFARFGMSPETTTGVITATYFIALLGLIAGYKTRLMATGAWLMHLVLNTTGHFTAYGVETFAHIALFYCMVLPVGACWSVDSFGKRFSLPPYLVTLSVRILQLHLCIMYLASGIEKALGSQWWNGEAIWIAMQQDQFHQVNIDWMAGMPLVPTLLGWGTLVVETLYPFGMLWSKTSKLWLLAIMSMHFFIAIFLGLHLFGSLMMLLNFSIFGAYCFPGIGCRLSAIADQLSAIGDKANNKETLSV